MQTRNPKSQERLSYTAPNFQGNTRNRHLFNQILNNAKNTKITVVLDWFSVLFVAEKGIIKEPEAEDKNFSQEIDRLTLVYTGKGQQHYKYIWNIFFEGEHLGQLLTHTRNEKFVKKDHVKLEVRNHVLYSTQLWPFYDLCVRALKLTYKNISRIDIAIDGMNYLMQFCNEYARQRAKEMMIEFKGRPTINCNVLDRPSRLYQHFRFGSKGGKKVIVIYNKSLDIVKTRKEYIQEYWKQNGILKNSLTIPREKEKRKKGTERTYLEGYENVYRFEIRIFGERIKEIEGFSINLLRTADGLMSVVKAMTVRFFDAYWIDHNNTSYCTPVDLLPFDQFEITPLQKVRLLERGDLYKTKLSINKNIKQLYTGRLTPDNASVFEMLKFDIELYELQKWVYKKWTDEWKEQYSAMQKDKNYVSQVDEFIQLILDDCSKEEN